MKKFYSYSFGCRVNEAEKEALDRELISQGFVFDKENPDLYIINTCAVTHKAERETRNFIYQIKKKLPQTKIVITGCSATYWLKNNLYQHLPVDLIIDNPSKEFLVEIIKRKLNLEGKNNLSGRPQDQKILSKFLASKRLMIKIQDGCHRFCSFCIVPYLRGLPKSARIDEILSSIKKINDQEKISEVILTAINTEAFGHETRENLIDLIDKILSQTSIPRLSFGSIHPWSITDQFINFYQKILTDNRLVNFFHIPIQSGSYTILHLMKRDYQSQEILEKLISLKKINPYLFLATDVIVGFLGETEKEFEETYNFLEKSPFCRFHVFRFSKRKNTAAFFLSRKIKEPDEKTKKIRSRILRNLSEKKYLLFLEKNLGRESTLLVLNKKIDNYFEGLLDNQLPSLVTCQRELLPGEIVRVKIERIKIDRLVSKIIE
ncbi:MAG: MiaB/RimO family radical SAM methylthiotransferase [Patescibacteria group bacterium]|nr:MiaB/RimO family radical SAM methylthiotransferase [Patescibacteria group bacterium]